jgi:thiamine biosynthesis lipoprotein
MTAALERASWQALGTSVELALSDGNVPAGASLADARAIVERQLDEVDCACSRFRADSELMRLNARSGRAVQIGPLLLEAIDVALRAAELTGGDVDPTIGGALLLAGYDQDWELLTLESSPDEALTDGGQEDDSINVQQEKDERGAQLDQRGALLERDSPCTTHVRATMRAGWKSVVLNRDRTTLRIPVGVKLDLGATAKAWATDRAAEAVYEATGRGVLLSLGGDISTAGPSPAGGWRIHVTDDHRSAPDAPGQTISIASGGLATSSTTVRRWRHEGRAMHHIIDPSTGVPVAEVWRTVSVAAANCTDANIAATAAIVRGERAVEWLSELGLPARLVARDGSVLTVGSWPTEQTHSPREHRRGSPAQAHALGDSPRGTPNFSPRDMADFSTRDQAPARSPQEWQSA